MRSPERIPIVLGHIQQVWQQHPDWRLGQLIVNLSERVGKDMWNIEEDELISAVEKHLASCPDAKSQGPKSG